MPLLDFRPWQPGYVVTAESFIVEPFVPESAFFVVAVARTDTLITQVLANTYFEHRSRRQ